MLYSHKSSNTILLQVKILQKGKCALVFRGLSWHRGRKKLEVCGCLDRPSDNEIYVTQTLVDPRGPQRTLRTCRRKKYKFGLWLVAEWARCDLHGGMTRPTHALPNNEKSLARSTLLNDVHQRGFRGEYTQCNRKVGIRHILALHHLLVNYKEDSGGSGNMQPLCLFLFSPSLEIVV